MAKKHKKTPDEAAIKIQARARGMIGRSVYAKKLMSVMWNEIYEDTWKAIRLSEIDKMRSIFAADEAIEQMNRVILWATFAYEPDPLHTDTPFTRPALRSPKKDDDNCGLWQPEDQPSTTVIDRHTRFEVAASPPGHSMAATRKARTPSTPSGRSLKSAGRQDSVGSLSQTLDSMTGSGVFGSEPAVDIRDISDPNEKGGRRGGAKGSISDIEREYFEQMEREKQEKIRKEKFDADRAAEAARVKAAWDEAMKEVDGKQWTVDAEGKVIVVTPVVGDKMPSRHVPVKYGVRVTDKSDSSNNKNRRKSEKLTSSSMKASGGSRSNTPDMNATTNSTKAIGSKVHFTESFDNQPPLIKTLQPEGGVGLQYGNQKKVGRQYTAGEKRMSRSDYLEKTGFTGGSDRSVEELDSSVMGGTSGGGGGLDSSGGIKSAASSAKGKSRGGGSRQNHSDKFPLIDPLKGGRPRAPGTLSPVGSPTKQSSPGTHKVQKGTESGMVSSPTTRQRSSGKDFDDDFDSGEDAFKSFEEIEAAAKTAELELLANMNNDLPFRTDKFDPAPVQRNREKVLYKPQRDVRNAHLEGPLPTANRNKLAPPTAVGMSTGHGSIVDSSSSVGVGGLGDISQNEGGTNQEDSAYDAPYTDDGSVGMSSAFVNGGGTSKSPESVIIPEESENQGLRYQIGIKDTNQFAKTRPV